MHGVHVFSQFGADAGEAEPQQVLGGIVSNGFVATLPEEVPQEIVAYQVLRLDQKGGGKPLADFLYNKKKPFLD